MATRYLPSPTGSRKAHKVLRREMDDPQRLERLKAHEAEIRRLLSPDKPKGRKKRSS